MVRARNDCKQNLPSFLHIWSFLVEYLDTKCIQIYRVSKTQKLWKTSKAFGFYLIDQLLVPPNETKSSTVINHKPTWLWFGAKKSPCGANPLWGKPWGKPQGNRKVFRPDLSQNCSERSQPSLVGYLNSIGSDMTVQIWSLPGTKKSILWANLRPAKPAEE